MLRTIITFAVTMGSLCPPALSQSVESFEQAKKRCGALSTQTDQVACLTEFLTSTWVTSTDTDKLDGSKSFIVMIMSPDKVSGKPGRSEEPILMIRCLKNRTQLMISWPSFLGLQGVPVKWRLDDQPVKSEQWGATSDGATAVASNPVDLSRKMLSAKELVISIEPYGKVATTVTFRLGGLAAAIMPLRETCKW